MEMPAFLLTHLDYLDVVEGRIVPNCSIRVQDGVIVEVSSGAVRTLRGERRMDLGGRVVMPGLIDCHVHCTRHLSGPSAGHQSTLTLAAARRAFRMLRRGFTTVRDAGGTDAGLRNAISQRIVPGPRVFIAGKALSQTGGHGDARSEFDQSDPAASGYSHSFGRVADGVDQFLRAARDELRLGADQVKIVACGGVGSSTSGLEEMQLSDDEVRAVVDEATRAGTYVMAHAYGARGVTRLVELGVRTIEHGNLIDEQTATVMARKGAFLVPNHIAYRSLAIHGRRQGYPSAGLERLKTIVATGTRAMELAMAAGVQVAYGSDLVMDAESQSEELLIRAEVASPIEVIRSATVIGARVVGQHGRLGTVAEGATADLLVVDGDPLADISLLTGQGSHLPLILKGGHIEKNALEGDHDQHWIEKWFPVESP